MKVFDSLKKQLGPGLMFAAASVGVSHLVQSTRSGASFGLELVPLIILVCFLKYPTYQFSSTYAQATGSSLLYGYRDIGRWALIVWMGIAFFTMAIITAAVVLVTAGALNVLLGTHIAANNLAILLMVPTVAILVIGGYNYLEKIVKILVLVFTFLMLFATANTLPNLNVEELNLFSLSAYSASNVFFLAALIGWMPNGTESSILQSTWVAEKARLNKGFKKSNMLFDLRLGYIGTVVLALAFVLMGASLMYSQGIQFEDSSVGFINQLVSLYSQSVGSWSAPVIKLTVFIILYTTVIAVIDGYSRVMSDGVLIIKEIPSQTTTSRYYYLFIGINCIFGYLIIHYWVSSFTQMIDSVTTLSFIIAPLIAILNMRALYTGAISKIDRPSQFMKYYGYTGIVFMSLFAISYLYIRFVYQG